MLTYSHTRKYGPDFAGLDGPDVLLVRVYAARPAVAVDRSPLARLADLLAPKAIGADEATVRALVAREAGLLDAATQSALVADILSRSAPRPATLRRIERGDFCHGDTRDLSVRYEGAYLRLSIAQAMALVELLPAGADLAERLRTDAACALREDHGISWERACALVAVKS